jgi:NADPH2:quinone reductase
MKAAVVLAPGELRVAEVAPPDLGPGQIRVRLQGCGVCASNLPPWEGKPWFTYPMEPGALGHEGWGIVDRATDGSGFEPGQRVGFLSGHAYAEYDVADASAVIPLPAALDDLPFPAEPLGCATNIFHRSAIRPGDTVAIVGIGFLGALLVSLVKRAGARVLAIGRRPFALEAAEQAGADDLIPMDDHWKIIERVRELTGGKFCEVVIEATGKQWPLDLAAELTAERGRLVIAGYHQDGPRQVNMQLWNWRGLDVINAHERDPAVYLSGMREAVAAVEEGALRPGPLFTHTFPLEELGAALDMTRDRPDGFMKALVIF